MEYPQKERYDFDDLVEIVTLLRAPGGCPWDREQTHKSIRSNFIEETYEAIEAIDNDENASDKDQKMLITLEVAYEYYLRGFEFLPIDIYKSHATKFQIVDGKLLPPFVAISGLGENAAWDIMKGREGKEFLSVEEFSAACPKVSKTHIQMLKDAGAFGSLPDTSQVSFF